jgi:hypothetical protein
MRWHFIDFAKGSRGGVRHPYLAEAITQVSDPGRKRVEKAHSCTVELNAD